MMGKHFYRNDPGRVLAAFMALVVFLCFSTTPAKADEKTRFETWVSDLRKEAMSIGISNETLDSAFREIKPITRVIELDRNQPESTLKFSEYLRRVIPGGFVAKGRQKMLENDAVLNMVSRRYGVQARFLVALWGVESRFGRYTGNFSVIGSLATLAFDGRRGSFFRKELLHALRIINEGHISAEKMKGSWAGAMGQVQFMPSSFNRFAADFDGDGRKDIWNNVQDILASAANYLSSQGWQKDQGWGYEVTLPEPFDQTLLGLKTRKPLSHWRALGVGRANNRNFPSKPDLQASLVRPGGLEGPVFIVHENYRVILKWNRSNFFGISVGTFSDGIELHDTRLRR